MLDDVKPIDPNRHGAEQTRPRRRSRFIMQVLWPAFLVTVIAEGLMFSLIDPHELVVVGLHLGDSRLAAYTVGFFVFWTLISAACALTWVLSAETRS